MCLFIKFYWKIRSVNEINELLTNLREKIEEVELQFGSLDDLRKQLKEKKAKYGVNIELASRLKQSCEVSKLLACDIVLLYCFSVSVSRVSTWEIQSRNVNACHRDTSNAWSIGSTCSFNWGICTVSAFKDLSPICCLWGSTRYLCYSFILALYSALPNQVLLLIWLFFYFIRVL